MNNKNSVSISVNILIDKKDDLYTGHCLELDIVATSDNIDQLKADLKDLIVAQIDYAFSNDNLDNLFHPAPAEIWKVFYKCKSQTEDKIMLKSAFQKENALKTFVPPWIIAKTCIAENLHLA